MVKCARALKKLGNWRAVRGGKYECVQKNRSGSPHRIWMGLLQFQRMPYVKGVEGGERESLCLFPKFEVFGYEIPPGLP